MRNFRVFDHVEHRKVMYLYEGQEVIKLNTII